MRKGFKYMCKFPGLEIPVWYEGHVMLPPACDPKRYYTGRYFVGTPIKIKTLDGRIRTGRVEGLESIELMRCKPYFRVGDNISFKLKNGKCYTGPVLFVVKESGEWFLKIPSCLTKLDNIEKFIVL